ncbi:hypothetical protein [Actinoplanes sp. L3-i22]|uniref:hypothetical protein n=1 Tax=Actinoplanes sp. L3-i22 TaxID=2836373 RepID=UPI001C852517|nr:hypothetical protein [Actinoplanes sp. L3-i22]
MSAVSDPIAGDGQRETGLVDVVGVSLTDLVNERGDSPVLRSIRRLQADLTDPNGVLSAFSSFIDKS